ncbi:hypothetical protein K2173_021057 [Erythroxylum novogranatense]|uniref:MAT1 centre domain-containing protein n=1 Tax=Erythroxylum novogranatense TaxID=1862640 RepID=A0AAV8TMH1_9ROSI|nr:hypothetical protein K2173_021057 [Erythroxylum novogranatense]
MVISSTNPFNKEIAIRKRISNIFNKREEDFPSLREYNDYLEEVEDMIFDLVSGVDVPAIETKIANYQKENAEQIMINQAGRCFRSSDSAEELAKALAASKGHPVQTDTDANSQGVFGGEGQYAPTVPAGQPRPTGMAPQPMPLRGGSDLHGNSADNDAVMKLRAERGIRAGGWSIELSRKRAIEEAFASIWI